jgi:hypothetical protein
MREREKERERERERWCRRERGNGRHLTIKCHGIFEKRERDFVGSFI